MSTDVTRRNFMQATGAVAGVAIASGYSPLSYAQNEKVRIGLIGTGSQGRFHIKHGIAGTPELEIVAIADVMRYGQFQGWNEAGGSVTLKEHLYYDYKEMLDKEKDNIDAVVIATPYKTHYQIVMDCLSAGKFVFCEKTMAHEYEMCRDIVTKCHETGKFVQCGHQRRYNPEYIYGMNQILAGQLGRITFIEAQWHRNDEWRRPLPKKKDGTDIVLDEEEAKLIPNLEHLVNWRIYKEYSAGLLSELATHHIEVCNWIMGTPPARVYTSGGIDYMRDDRTTDDNVALIFEYDVSPRNHGFGTISGRSQAQDISKINKAYTVRFTWSGLLTSWRKGEGILLLGDKGAFEMHERNEPKDKGCVFYQEPEKIFLDPKTLKPTKDETIIAWIKSSGRTAEFTRLEDVPPVPFEKNMPADSYNVWPDVRQFKAFAHHIKNGGVPRTNQMCGMMAAICDIAADQALESKAVVKIDPSIYKFDFETPDPFSTDSTLL